MVTHETQVRHGALRRSLPYAQVEFGFPGVYFPRFFPFPVYVLLVLIIQIWDILFVHTGT